MAELYASSRVYVQMLSNAYTVASIKALHRKYDRATKINRLFCPHSQKITWTTLAKMRKLRIQKGRKNGESVQPSSRRRIRTKWWRKQRKRMWRYVWSTYHSNVPKCPRGHHVARKLYANSCAYSAASGKYHLRSQAVLRCCFYAEHPEVRVYFFLSVVNY